MKTYLVSNSKLEEYTVYNPEVWDSPWKVLFPKGSFPANHHFSEAMGYAHVKLHPLVLQYLQTGPGLQKLLSMDLQVTPLASTGRKPPAASLWALPPTKNNEHTFKTHQEKFVWGILILYRRGFAIRFPKIWVSSTKPEPQVGSFSSGRRSSVSPINRRTGAARLQGSNQIRKYHRVFISPYHLYLMQPKGKVLILRVILIGFLQAKGP